MAGPVCGLAPARVLIRNARAFRVEVIEGIRARRNRLRFLDEIGADSFNHFKRGLMPRPLADTCGRGLFKAHREDEDKRSLPMTHGPPRTVTLTPNPYPLTPHL